MSSAGEWSRLDSADRDAKISGRVTAVNQAGSTVTTSSEAGPTERGGVPIL